MTPSRSRASSERMSTKQCARPRRVERALRREALDPRLGLAEQLIERPHLIHAAESTIVAVRPRPDRLERLPPQYFAGLLRRVAEAGVDVVDLGRGNPEVGPPAHVVEVLQRAVARPEVHGYAPFRGL